MNTCDTCKWWKDYSDKTKTGFCNNEYLNKYEIVRLYRLDGVEYDDYANVPTGHEGRVELVDTFMRATSLSSAYIYAVHCDYEVLSTGPKFGCIHHELKPSDKKCDYCGKPMAAWVGIKRTCWDAQCRESARLEQQAGPKVNQVQMLEMIQAEERRRENEPK